MYVCMQAFVCECVQAVSVSRSVCAIADTQHPGHKEESARRLAISTAGSKQAGCPQHWGSLTVREDSSFCNSEVQNASHCVLSYDCKNVMRQDSLVGTATRLRSRRKCYVLIPFRSMRFFASPKRQHRFWFMFSCNSVSVTS